MIADGISCLRQYGFISFTMNYDLCKPGLMRGEGGGGRAKDSRGQHVASQYWKQKHCENVSFILVLNFRQTFSLSWIKIMYCKNWHVKVWAYLGGRACQGMGFYKRVNSIRMKVYSFLQHVI